MSRDVKVESKATPAGRARAVQGAGRRIATSRWLYWESHQAHEGAKSCEQDCDTGPQGKYTAALEVRNVL